MKASVGDVVRGGWVFIKSAGDLDGVAGSKTRIAQAAPTYVAEHCGGL
jgi:hypothetical protein